MADDNVDWRFLGRQVQILQGDVRDHRSDSLRLDSELAGVKAELARMQAANGARFEQMDERLQRLEREMREGFTAVDAKLEEIRRVMAANLESVLAAIRT